VTPSSATAGGTGFALTVNGSNFISGAQVELTNPGNFAMPVARPATTFVSATQLTTQVSAAEIASPGTLQVSVFNPNFSVTSNMVRFVVNPGAPGVTGTISVAANGATPNGNSHDPVLSATGQFVAFSSEATNLFSAGTKFPEGYVRDTCLGAENCTSTTQLVSAISGGSSEGNGQGGATPSIGNQGRFVGFLSTATDLVTPNTATQQGYLRDTCADAPAGCTPITVLASVMQGGGAPNGAGIEFMIANNGCAAAFVSAGTNVLSGVSAPDEVYVSSCSSGGPAGGFTTTTLVSASNSGVAGDQGGQQPAISTDGRFVAFASTSTNLTSTPNGGAQQIYLRDTCLQAGSGCAASTTMVSVDSSGNALAGSSQFPAISDDGRFVVFNTQVPLPTGGIMSDVSIHDTCNSSSGPVSNCVRSTNKVSVASNGGASNGASSSGRHAVSGDGRFVVFSSSATDLIAGGNPATQVFVRDTCQSSSGNVSGCTPSEHGAHFEGQQWCCNRRIQCSDQHRWALRGVRERDHDISDPLRGNGILTVNRRHTGLQGGLRILDGFTKLLERVDALLPPA
jgi:hypothetical protein